MAFPAEHPNLGRPKQFGESHGVEGPLAAKNAGVRRFGGSGLCHGVAATPPRRDKGLRRFGGSQKCEGFVDTHPVRDQGPWKSGLPCTSLKVMDGAAVEHKSLRRPGRDFTMEKDQKPRPFGHQGQRSSHSRLQRLLQRSLDFGVGMDGGSHYGWIFRLDLPVSLLDDLGRDWNLIEHHRGGAAQTLRCMPKITNLQSCRLQLDRANARENRVKQH